MDIPIRSSLFWFAIGASLLVGACHLEEDPFKIPEDETRAYFPLELGRYWEYQVDSTIYDYNAEERVRTVCMEVREEVVDTFFDLTQHPWYRIERFERPCDSLQWAIKQVLAVTIRGNEALRQENNLTFTKLVFPLAPFNSWEGNRYIDPETEVLISGESVVMFNGWEYRVLSMDAPETVNGQLFGEVSTIQNADQENPYEKRYAREKYAKGVGLVERSLEILDTQDTTKLFLPWPEKAEKGFELHQILTGTNG